MDVKAVNSIYYENFVSTTSYRPSPPSNTTYPLAGISRNGTLQAAGHRQIGHPDVPPGSDHLPTADAAPATLRARLM